MDEVESGFESLFEALPNDLTSDGIEFESVREDRKIRGGDGQEIFLHIYKPQVMGGSVPCVMFFHGVGMAILRALNKVVCILVAKRTTEFSFNR